ncbi:hypothetical protein Tco_0538631 [Tanacetum coccineum]
MIVVLDVNVHSFQARLGVFVSGWYRAKGYREIQVMAAPVISISSDTSEESVGSHATTDRESDADEHEDSCIEGFSRRWRSIPLLPLTTDESESPLGSSFGERFREFISPEDSGEEHMEVDTTDAEAVADIGISEGVVAHPRDGYVWDLRLCAVMLGRMMGVVETEARVYQLLEDTIYDIVHYMSEVRIDRITEIETTQRQLETSQMVASRERASLVERIGSLRLEYLKEEFRQVRRDRDDTQRRLRRLESLSNQSQSTSSTVTSDNGNGGNRDGENRNGQNGNGGNGNPNKNGRGDRYVARECTYKDFMKCQLLNFKGTEGVVGLIRWFEKIETLFHTSNCPERYQVKYATFTLLNSTLTWWNSHKRTIGTEAAFFMSWRELMKLMTEVYCPRNDIQKMETEL